jgi:HPt (histidine-containing phosphotransfer) domain-containing protein
MAAEEPRVYVAYVDKDLEELVPDFFNNRHNDIQKIVAALERQDFDAIRGIGHTLKGVGGGYGFDDITDFGREIETAAKAGNSDDILYWINELYRYLTEVQIYYQ